MRGKPDQIPSGIALLAPRGIEFRPGSTDSRNVLEGFPCPRSPWRRLQFVYPGTSGSNNGDPRLLQLIRTYTKPRSVILTVLVYTLIHDSAFETCLLSHRRDVPSNACCVRGRESLRAGLCFSRFASSHENPTMAVTVMSLSVSVSPLLQGLDRYMETMEHLRLDADARLWHDRFYAIPVRPHPSVLVRYSTCSILSAISPCMSHLAIPSLHQNKIALVDASNSPCGRKGLGLAMGRGSPGARPTLAYRASPPAQEDCIYSLPSADLDRHCLYGGDPSVACSRSVASTSDLSETTCSGKMRRP